MNVHIQAASSSGGSYDCEFSDEGDYLRVTCNCQAGLLRQVCKHKVALLRGDRKMLFDPDQETLLDMVMSSPGYTVLKAHLDEYEVTLFSIEKEVSRLKETEKSIKARLAHEFIHGPK